MSPRKNKPSREQVKRWQRKNWEKNWDKELLSFVLNNIIELWNEGGTIIAPNWEVLGYLLGESRIPYLLHCLIKLEKQEKKICLIRKGEELYLDYIPF